MRKNQRVNSLRSVFAAGLFTLGFLGADAQPLCDFQDDYSNVANWTQVGTNVNVSSGVVNFINGSACATSRRVHQPLGVTLGQNDTWEASIDFSPTSVGGSTSLPMTGHNILAITAGTLEPLSDCTGGCSNENQDGIVVTYITTNPSDGNIYFRIGAKNGTLEQNSLFTAPMNGLPSSYHLVLRRTCVNLIELDVFDITGTTLLTSTSLTLSNGYDVSGLTHVQHGNVWRGFSARRLNATIDNLCMNWTLCNGPCDLVDDYTNPSLWTQVGANVTVAGGQVNYLNGAADAMERRVYRPLGVTLNHNDNFCASLDFSPQSVGGTTAAPMTGHIVLALTDGTLEALSDCSGGCTNQNQDGIIVSYLTTNPSDGNIYFRITAKDGTLEDPSIFTSAVAAPANEFHLVLQRTCGDQLTLSVFDNTGGVLGALLTTTSMTINSLWNVGNLTHVQHGNTWRGFNPRQLTGTIDNLCMRWDVPSNLPNVFSHSSQDNLINNASGTMPVNTGIAMAPEPIGSTTTKFTAAVWDNPLNNTYEIQWFDDNAVSFQGGFMKGVDPDVAYYSDAEFCFVTCENNGRIMVDEYTLSWNGFNFSYGFNYREPISTGTYPNIDMNSNAKGVVSWEDAGNVFIQPVAGVGFLTKGLMENVGQGTQPDVVLTDDGMDVIVTYVNGNGDLVIVDYDYQSLIPPSTTPAVNNTWVISANGDPYAYPRIAAPRNVNFYGGNDDFTVVAERSTSGGMERIEGVTRLASVMQPPYLVNNGFESCSNSFPVVTYFMDKLSVAWATEYSGCSSTLNIMDIPPQEDIIIKEYDPSTLAPLNSGDYYEVNANQGGFDIGRPAINTTYDGSYPVSTPNDGRESIIFYNPSNIYWKKRGFGGQYKTENAQTEDVAEMASHRLVANPVRNEIIVEGEDLQGVSVQLMDMSGRYFQVVPSMNGNQRMVIPVAHLSHGMYILTLQKDGNTEVLKLIKE